MQKKLLSLMLTTWFYGAALFAINLNTSTANAQAKQYSFDEVMNLVESSSSVLKAMDGKISAAELNQSRMEKHWSPKLFVDVKSFNTNDPANVFMSNLQQRKIENSDFNPDTLNNPDRIQAQKGSLMLDMPLYEGGRPTALLDITKSQTQLMSVEKQQQRNQLRAQVFKLYYNLVKLNEEKLKIEKLQATTDKILESYQLRKNENPVGYSGYLGLKALKEQLDSQLTSMQQQKKLIYSSIAELISTTTTTTSIESGNESTRNSVKNSMKLSALPDQWQPENKSVEQIRQQLEKYISNASKVSADAQTQGQQSDSSIKSKIANTPEYQMAVVQKNMADKNKLVQTSYWKPELGAFGETYLMNGSRGTATGNTVGVYLRWGFSGQLVGNVDQAKKEALAAQYYADAIEQKITVQTLSQMEGNQVIETQIKSTEQTLALLEEQTTMMKKLYQSGAINSLQLVDVFSRHLMLIQQQSQLKTQWINNLSNLIQIYGLESGVNHASK